MARRGRGSAARTKPTPGGRDTAVNGSGVNGSAVDDVDVPGDEPGARTIGALALKRWAARAPGRGSADDEGDPPRTHGPFDEQDLADAPAGPERVDFGAVRVPVPPGGQVSVEPEDGRLQAVHVMLPAGRLSVSALAAPRTERLWPDLAAEIDESLREGGATVRSFTGEWGRELHARTGDASSLFVGVDGPRWMLYGVATGPTSAARELDAALRTMLRGTVVVRGRSPYPVRTVLPLAVPGQLAHGAPLPGPERVPVPRTTSEGVAPPPRSAPTVEAPTTITTGAVGRNAGPDAADVDTVPHGLPRAVPGPPADPRTTPAHDSVGDSGSHEASPETGVSRTASRGLFRRKPERPPARPTQRRVADLIAEAERDRAAARAASQAQPRPHPDVPASPPASLTARPTPQERLAPSGHDVDRARTNGYVPRELTHDRPAPDGPARNGRSATNGAGPAPDEAAGDGARFDAPAHGPRPFEPVNGSYGGAYDGGAYGGSPAEPSPPEALPVNGSHDFRSYAAAPSGPAADWLRPHDPVAGPGRYDADHDPAGGRRPSSAVADDGSDDWTLPLPVVRPAPEPEPERPVLPAAPARSRRARREAEERAGNRTTGPWVPQEWGPGASTADRWTPEPQAVDRWTPDRPGYTRGHHEPGFGADERPARPERRAERPPSRHAEEGDGVGRRARHRRPEG